jgi:glycosyltransferase involved in cell wall biosynthesis
VLEAAAAGIPLIATAVGGIAEIFGDDRNALIPAGDPAALAQAMVAAREQPQAVAALSQRLQARVQAKFSVDAMCEQVLAAYAAARQQGNFRR